MSLRAAAGRVARALRAYRDQGGEAIFILTRRLLRQEEHPPRNDMIIV